MVFLEHLDDCAKHPYSAHGQRDYLPHVLFFMQGTKAVMLKPNFIWERCASACVVRVSRVNNVVIFGALGLLSALLENPKELSFIRERCVRLSVCVTAPHGTYWLVAAAVSATHKHLYVYKTGSRLPPPFPIPAA